MHKIVGPGIRLPLTPPWLPPSIQGEVEPLNLSSGLQSKGAALSKHSKVRSVHTQSLVQEAACPTKLRESEGLLLPGGSTWL